ncbi:hypothetical protein DWW91_26445 [Parabacteroides sp. AF17-3]|uniref:fimbrillin family protein n=1 Tax=Parabacteroides sp. AF17-3 TaxID=2293113 RepID=UPI000F006136|nr:fimbrillin family protein [Parabacteroides sp. AF17-3]RKU62329.1 hypothetical protein DWW91_26445 [Parabacteroides sp. AF17-3]
MKRQRIYLLLFPALLLVSGCSDSDCSEPEQVPIELHAQGNATVETKADQTITEAFATTVFASMRSGDYTGLTSPVNAKEWKIDTEVQTNGTVPLSGNPTYPENGDWLYLIAVAPQASSYSDNDGKVTYTLTGQTDLMYASQISGSRWDGNHFVPLTYKHLLTQLTFKAMKKVTGGLSVKVKKITVTTTNSVTLALTNGETSFSGSGELSLELPDGGTEISGTTATPLSGSLLLPPLTGTSDAYKLTVETSIGTFKDLEITPQSDGGNLSFAGGTSHEITLNIGDKELGISSVTVSGWVPVIQNDDLNLVE